MSATSQPTPAAGAEPGGPIVCPAVLDLASAAWLKDAILRAMETSPHRPIAVDASAVVQIDTANLQILLAARRDLQRQGATLALRSPSPALLRVASRLGLTAALDLTDLERRAADGGASAGTSDEKR